MSIKIEATKTITAETVTETVNRIVITLGGSALPGQVESAIGMVQTCIGDRVVTTELTEKMVDDLFKTLELDKVSKDGISNINVKKSVVTK
jgi:hypothetical protein